MIVIPGHTGHYLCAHTYQGLLCHPDKRREYVRGQLTGVAESRRLKCLCNTDAHAHTDNGLKLEDVNLAFFRKHISTAYNVRPRRPRDLERGAADCATSRLMTFCGKLYR